MHSFKHMTILKKFFLAKQNKIWPKKFFYVMNKQLPSYIMGHGTPVYSTPQ
jgi:hypothetical protein